MNFMKTYALVVAVTSKYSVSKHQSIGKIFSIYWLNILSSSSEWKSSNTQQYALKVPLHGLVCHPCITWAVANPARWRKVGGHVAHMCIAQ